MIIKKIFNKENKAETDNQDALIFYHKKNHTNQNYSWIKIQMVPEIIKC